MSKFEDYIKKSVEDYKVEYNPNHWTKIEQQLASPSGAGFGKKLALGSAVLIGAAVIGYFTLAPDKAVESKLPEPKVQLQPEQPTEVKKDNSEPTIVEKDTPNIVKPASTETVVEKEAPSISEKELPPTENTASMQTEEEHVIMEPEADWSIDISREEACVAEIVSFKSNIVEPVNYKWSFGDGTTSELPQPNHKYKKTGKYTVSLTVTSLISGKSKKVVASEAVRVNPKPLADFDYHLMQTEDFSQKVSLSPLTTDYKHAEWVIGKESILKGEVSHNFNNKGNYPVKLIVSNSFGCYDTIVKVVTVENDYNLLAPNAFTPDQDGLNDVFLPRALENSSLPYQLEVFEAATGKLVYSTNQDGSGWDGKDINTGNMAHPGDYAWTVKLTKENGEHEIFKGTLKLLQP